MNPRKKHHRRNPPEIAGIKLPNIEETLMLSAGVAGGIAGPPIIQGFINPWLVSAGIIQTPAPATASSIPALLVKGVSYALPIAIGYWVGGRNGAKAGVFVSAIQSMAASLPGGTTTSGYIPRAAAFRGYTNLVPRASLAALPVPIHGRDLSRSLSRGTRFASPRMR
jgi:hypothetical protein